MLEKFSIQMLGVIDAGRLAVAFEQSLDRVRHDLDDRAAIDKDRKITLECIFRPVADDRGNLDSVDVAFRVKDNTPTRQTASYNMKATRAGLLWNELSPAEVRQKTIDEVDGPKPLEEKKA